MKIELHDDAGPYVVEVPKVSDPKSWDLLKLRLTNGRTHGSEDVRPDWEWHPSLPILTSYGDGTGHDEEVMRWNVLLAVYGTVCMNEEFGPERNDPCEMSAIFFLGQDPDTGWHCFRDDSMFGVEYYVRVHPDGVVEHWCEDYSCKFAPEEILETVRPALREGNVIE